SYDRVRDWAEGRLAPDEALRFQRELASDPDLRAAAEEYKAVSRWTEVVTGDVPPSRLRFEDIEAAMDATASPSSSSSGRLLSMRRVAAAAAVIAVAAVGAWAYARSRGPEPVVLATVP